MKARSFLLVVTGLAVSLIVSGCGKGAEAPPAAPPGAPPGPVVPTFSGNLEDVSPGTQLTQANYQQAFQAMSKNLTGLGTANVSGQVLIDYIVQPGYRDALFTRQQGAPNQPQTPAAVSLKYEGFSQGYLEDLSIVLTSNYREYYQFNLVFEYELYGKILYTTDQMAIFVSRGYPKQVLKVMYNSPNPAMNLYAIEEYPSYGGSYGNQIRLHVSQKNITTQIQAPQQGQYPR